MRNEFIDYLLSNGNIQRFDEHQIDAIEQFCFALFDNTDLSEQEKRIERLKDIICAHQIADETGYIDEIGFIEGFHLMDGESANIFTSFKLEQQAKGIEDFLQNTKPYMQIGAQKIWRFSNEMSDGYIRQLRKQAKEGAE